MCTRRTSVEKMRSHTEEAFVHLKRKKRTASQEPDARAEHVTRLTAIVSSPFPSLSWIM